MTNLNYAVISSNGTLHNFEGHTALASDVVAINSEIGYVIFHGAVERVLYVNFDDLLTALF